MNRNKPITFSLKKSILTFLLFPVFVYTQSIAASLTGIVRNENSEPLAGALVKLSSKSGINAKTTSNNEGIFSLENITPASDYAITVSKDAYKNTTLTNYKIEGSNKLSLVVDMKPAQTAAAIPQSFENNALPSVAGIDSNTTNAKTQDEVIVTSMGIKRSTKSLTYSAQSINADELQEVKSPNLINALAGKVAGMMISNSGSGEGGSVKVVLRGNKSLTNNSPLYVIDGIPMVNMPSAQPTDIGGGSIGGRDGGDAIGNINPDDIGSISVLNGASAAALYGSQAGNGAILITTKKAKPNTMSVTLSNTTTFQIVDKSTTPTLQYKYAAKNSEQNWGTDAVNLGTNDLVNSFFKTGMTTINSLSLAASGDHSQAYFSYANTYSNGILQTNNLNRNNISLRLSADFWNKFLVLDGSAMYISQAVLNRASPSNFTLNPVVGAYLMPRYLNFDEVSNNYQIFNAASNLYKENWIAGAQMARFNPYWQLNNIPQTDILNRTIVYGSATLNFLPNLNLRLKGSQDKMTSSYELKGNAGTASTIDIDPNGRYIVSQVANTQYYGEATLNYNTQVKDISFVALFGTSILISNLNNGFSADSRTTGLRYPNIFSLQNINLAAANISQTVTKRELQAVFATVQAGYKNYAYLDLTARNDWSSTLPTQSFFYWSAGASLIINQMITLPSFFDLVKLRASYAVVGNDVPAYVNNPINNISSVSGLITNTAAPKPGIDLKPEQSQSFETGINIIVGKGLFNFDATYYKTNTFNQFLAVSAPVASGLSQYYINAGNIQNQGIELRLSAEPVKIKNTMSWLSTLIFTKNTNQVIALTDELKQVTLSEPGNNSYAYIVQEGNPFGDIWGRTFKRDDQGRIMLDANKKPIQNTKLGVIANPTPDFIMSWRNEFTILKNLSLAVLLDARFGGKVLSLTQSITDEAGASQASADARDNGGVSGSFVDASGNAVATVDAKTFYTTVGGRAGISEYYVYDATNIRIRELSLSYNIPQHIYKTNFIKGISVSFIARNLMFLYKPAPYDANQAASTGTSFQGLDVFGLPTTRSIGFNVKINL